MPNLGENDSAKQAVKRALGSDSSTQLKVAVTGLDKVTGEFKIIPIKLAGD